MEHCTPISDPLNLHDKPTANAVRIARATPHADVEKLYARLTDGRHADPVEVRVLLLAHLIYIVYRDIKESFAT